MLVGSLSIPADYVRPRFRCPYRVVDMLLMALSSLSSSLQGGIYTISSSCDRKTSSVRVDVDASMLALDITDSVACEQLTRHIGNGKRNQARVSSMLD